MKTCTRSRLGLSVALVATSVILAPGRALAQWRVDPRPVFDLGAENDTLDSFGQVQGVTRLRNGEIIVADRKYYSLRYFSPDGRFLRAVGRKGGGPGEFEDILHFWRCGDTLFVRDWNSPHIFIFSAAGKYARTIMLAPPAPGEEPYRSECNALRTFVSFGWERGHKPGLFRPDVLFWLSNGSGAVTKVLGRHPGGERYGEVSEGRFVGTMPMPLGKQTSIAIGQTRFYIGTADSFAIEVYTLDGRRAGTIVQPAAVNLRTTPADISRFIALDTAGRESRDQANEIKRMAGVKYPRTVPAYSDMRVDSEDDLWVERFPRAGDARSHWEIFSAPGVHLAQVELPLDFNVREIGHDYVLGVQKMSPDGVEHVRMFRVTRGRMH